MNQFFKFVTPHGYVIRPTEPRDAVSLEELQRIVFPTLSEYERFKAHHYQRHIELFPDGQYVCAHEERIIGMTSAIRLNFHFEDPGHTFADVIQGGWLTSHEPDGPWLYGADIGIHPDYRRKGIARALYAARQHCVRFHRLKGQVTVGMLSGYGAVKNQLSAEEYYDELLKGDRTDPTVSAQMRVGFQPRGLLHGYVNDPLCDNYGVILVLPIET